MVEGEKIIFDLLDSKPQIIRSLYVTETWLEGNNRHKNLNDVPEINVVSTQEIKKISSLKSIPSVIAVAAIESNILNDDEILTSLSLMLETVQDPGNLGTIIRIADWFGIRNIICSHDCADCYNPKVVQATMGAIARVKMHYLNLDEFLSKYSQVPEYHIYGTFLAGENIYTTTLSTNGAIILGNESKGISKSVAHFIRYRIFIPPIDAGDERVDSLNVSSAAAIVCSEFRRRLL